MPLPAGRMRFYRSDAADGLLEFVGENEIDHTPKNETVRVYTGNAFDIVGERKQTDFAVDLNDNWARETFAITLRNRKETPVEVRVVEKLFRGAGWDIRQHSHEFEKQDAQTVEFPVTVPADGEVVVTYTVRYAW